MKYLLLMRHGEAEGHPDIHRRLTDTGRIQCSRIGYLLRQSNILPDIIITSSVQRVQESYAELGLDNIHHISCGTDLYRAQSVTDVISTITSHVPSEKKCALIIGHNPFIHETALYLGRKNPNAFFEKIQSVYNPATTTIIKYDGQDWDDITPSKCEVIHVLMGK